MTAVPAVAQEMNLELIMNDKLEKANITDLVINGLKEKYSGLKINGQDDKEGYKNVVNARKECKSWRVAAKKICEEGRDEAVKTQKAWVAKEKEVTGKILEIETLLQKEEDAYEAEKERIKAEKKALEDNRLTKRTVELTGMGASLIDGFFVLGEVKYQINDIRESDDEKYTNEIFPQYSNLFKLAEEARIKAENERKEAEEQLMREKEELRQQQYKFAMEQQKIKEEQDRKEREEAEKRDAIMQGRYQKLQSIGMTYDFKFDAFVYEGVNVDNKTEIALWDEGTFNSKVVEFQNEIQKIKQQKEESDRIKLEAMRKLAEEQAAQKERERIAEQRFEEEKRKIEEEAIRREEAEKATDKEKWNWFIEKIKEIELPTVTGKVYSSKLKKASELLGQVVNL